MPEIPTEIDPAIAEIPQTNDTIGENPPDSQAGFAAKIGEFAKRSYGKIANKVRGRGRPKNCPECGIPETQCKHALEAGAGVALEAGGDVGGASVDEELIGEAVGAVVKTVTGTGDYFLLKKALEKTSDREWIERTLSRCQPTEKELAAIGKLSAIWMKEEGLINKHSYRWGLVAIAAGIAGRYAVVFVDLSSLPAKMEKAA